MTIREFSTLINDPFLTGNASLKALEDCVTRYPYCQSLQILLTCNFYTANDTQYPEQLKKAAAYAGDRRRLREVILQAKKSGNIQQRSVTIPETASQIPGLPIERPDREHKFQESENASPAYERMTPEELLSIVKKRLAEIEADKKRDEAKSGASDPVSEILDSTSRIPGPGSRLPDPATPLTKASLIEKFIRDDPRISKPKAAFFNPTDSAIRSNFDEEEIVSETLAQLYAQQGNITKAIHIYEKLSLINQEKSRFFAAQIEKLTS